MSQIAYWDSGTKELKYRDATPEEEAEIAARATASIAVTQALVWEDIKRERDDVRTEGGVLVGSHWFHTDTASRIKWLGLKDSARDMLAAGGTTADVIYVNGGAVQWKTMSGAFVPVNVQLALDVVDATKVLDAKLFMAAETHRSLMLQAANPAAYDHSTGWPERYQPA
jgi:hypothetical protein